MSFILKGQNITEKSWENIPENANFYKIQKEFYSNWEQRAPQKGQGYNVFKRWEAQVSPRVYPSGDLRLTATTYSNFTNWQKENPQSTQRSAPNNWSSLGPFSIPSGYDAGVGRVDFIKFHPTNSNIIFVGTPDGGLWKSTNGGSSWSTETDFLGVIGCSDLLIHPTNPNTMYLATGNWEDDRRSIGVLKSTNGGDTWTTTSLSWTATDNYKIRRMVMDPSDPNKMMVATDGGIFRTTDGWSSAPDNSGLDGNHNLYDVAFKPGSSTVVYASGVRGSEVFWKSTDGGATWTNISSGLPSGTNVQRILIGLAPSNSAYVYLLAGNNAGGYLGLYRSTNSGASFTTRSTTPNILQASKTGSGTGGQAFHDLAISVAPDNAEKVTVGGINSWRSTDGGSTWTLFTYWLGIDNNYPGEGSDAPYVHADVQAIEYLPGSSSTIFISSDGGIYKSTDDGANFSAISNNLSIAQQTNVAQSLSTESLIVTGLQDIGTIKKSGSAYSVINGGDGESAFIDRSSNNVIVTSNPNGNHAISYDGGLTRQDITGLPSGTEFYSPVSQDPTNVDIMYAGGRPKFYKNIDFFNHPNTWVDIGTPPGTGSVLEYVVAPSDNKIIYTIKSNAIGKTINGGTSWTNVTNGLPLGSARATQITVSNTDPNKAWITFSGYSAANKVFKTTNGGTSWTNISTGLPNLPFNTVVYVKNSPNDEVYIGGDIGVYHYENPSGGRGPGSWTLYNSDLPNTKITDLEIFYPTTGSPKLRASTYGRGTWETEISTSVVPVELLAFNGSIENNGNLLTWSTASEVDLLKYEIQRSNNRKDYEMIGNVIAESSNSQTERTYEFLDRNFANGLNYYRMKIIDIDGSFEYSPSIVLHNSNRDKDVKVVPNPTSDYLMVTGISDKKATVTIRDVTGRFIYSQQIEASGKVLVNYLPNGKYYAEIAIDNDRLTILPFIKI